MRAGLRSRYAKMRVLPMVPATLAEGQAILLTPGKHSELMRAIIEQFAPRFVPGGRVLYIGDTGKKWGYGDQETLHQIGGPLDPHGKMPDGIIYFAEKN